MKLIRCHIDNFGKLHDYSMDFTEQETIICEENGWGKSTFAAFLRAMFYGLDGKGKRALEANEYARYTPWQGGVFGGKIVFEANGKEYELTRHFGGAEDFELRDAKTNLISEDYSEDIGKELFKIDRESFMRTSFIGQNDCRTFTTDDINAKIGNLTDNSNDLNYYEKADGRLKDLLNAMAPNRKTGSINRRTNEITELERKVAERSRIPDSLTFYQEKIKQEQAVFDEVREQIRIAGAQQERISKLQGAIAKKKQWDGLVSECQKQQERTEGLRKAFPNEVPTIAEVEEKQEQYMSMEKAAVKVSAYEITDQEKAFVAEKGDMSKIPILMLVGLIVAVVGVAVAILVSLVPGIVTALLGVILIGVSVVTNKKEQKALAEARAARQEQLRSKEEKLAIAKNEYEKNREAVYGFLERYGYQPSHDLQGQLMQIRDDIQDYLIQKKIYEEAYVKMQIFQSETDASILTMQISEEAIPTLYEINEKIEKLTEERERRFETIKRYKMNLEGLQEQLDEWEETKVRLEELRSIQESEKQKYAHLDKAREYLGKAKESITAKYVGPILESFAKYYEVIANHSAGHFRMDANANITVEELGKQREVAALSSGYKDLVGVCLRVAFVDAMYTDELPVLIMDDPFINLDDQKMKAAKVFLKEVTKKYQIIYLTCSEARILF